MHVRVNCILCMNIVWLMPVFPFWINISDVCNFRSHTQILFKSLLIVSHIVISLAYKYVMHPHFLEMTIKTEVASSDENNHRSVIFRQEMRIHWMLVKSEFKLSLSLKSYAKSQNLRRWRSVLQDILYISVYAFTFVWRSSLEVCEISLWE